MEISANGNPIAELVPGRVTARIVGNTLLGTVSWRHVDPLASANFRIIETSELRVYEDGDIVELG